MWRHGVFEVGYVFHGNYRVVRVLGRGGMGTVLEVEHTRLPRRLALKVMTSPVSAASEDMMRFRREAETLASLYHPNLVVVFDWNITEEERLPYLVMELLSGEDLAQVLKRSGALPQHVAISILAQVINALDLVHSRNIVHRDLKPANLFVCKNGVIPHFIKVLDFGIAKNNQPNSALETNNLVLMGTPAYMAPEQARGDLGPVGPRTDQFALGLLLYEMLTGCPAFYRPREPAMTTLFRIMHEEPRQLVDAAMNAAVMRALRKHPDERYPSLSDFLRAVLAAASVPAEAIEIPERTEKVGVRSVGAAGPATAVAASERVAEERSQGEHSESRMWLEPSESVMRPTHTGQPASSSRVERRGRSAMESLPGGVPLPSQPSVPPLAPASRLAPEAEGEGSASGSGTYGPAGGRTGPGGSAVGQSLPRISPARTPVRLALAMLPFLLLVGLALREPRASLAWLASLRRSASAPVRAASVSVEPVPLLADGGGHFDGGAVSDLAPREEAPPDLTSTAPPPASPPSDERPAKPAGEKSPRARRPAHYRLRFSGIERGHPERDHVLECIDTNLNIQDRLLLVKTAALELCWTAKRGWNIVTSVWIHNERIRNTIEPCLNSGFVLPTTRNPCFVVSAEEER
ncbi:MAG: protein kinase [Myxococcales bacterium]|nr:protein kinase [Myxococcales bacterium]